MKKTKAKAPHLSGEDLKGQLANAHEHAFPLKPALLQRFKTKEAIEKQNAKIKENYEKLKTMKKNILGEIDELRDNYYE